MKHTLFAGLLASAGLTAATIGGSLYDPSGAVVPNAKALLYDPDTNTKLKQLRRLMANSLLKPCRLANTFCVCKVPVSPRSFVNSM